MLVWRAWATPNQTPWPDDLNSDTTFCGKYQQSSGPNNSYPPFLFIQMFFFLIPTFLVHPHILLPHTHLSYLFRSSSSSDPSFMVIQIFFFLICTLFIHVFFFLIPTVLVHPIVLLPYTQLSCSSTCSSSAYSHFLFIQMFLFLRPTFLELILTFQSLLKGAWRKLSHNKYILS